MAVARGEGAAFGGHLRELLQERADLSRRFALLPGGAAVRIQAAHALAVCAGAGDEGDAFRQAGADAGLQFFQFGCAVEVGFVEDDQHRFVEGVQAQDGDHVAFGEVLVDDVGDDMHAPRGVHHFLVERAVCARLVRAGHVEQGEAEAARVFVVVTLDGGGAAADDGGVDGRVRQKRLDERAFAGTDFAEEGEFQLLRFGGDGFNFGVDGAGVEALRAGGGGARL